MTVLLLVRHGQASFGAADYDVLSETGHAQARALGAWLSSRVVPDALIAGTMRRHRETVSALTSAAGWSLPVQEDGGWDEFDHEHVIEQFSPGPRDLDRAAFQHLFEKATERWASGADGYKEPFPAFTERVLGAFDRAVAASSGTVLVVTSGGPISAVACRLLAGGADTWARLNIAGANTGVTKVVAGRRGPTLVTFNEHSHLDRSLLTYR